MKRASRSSQAGLSCLQSLDLGGPTTRHLYCSAIKVSASYGRSPRPYQAAGSVHGRRKVHELNMVPTMSERKCNRAYHRRHLEELHAKISAKTHRQLVSLARVSSSFEQTTADPTKHHQGRQKQPKHVCPYPGTADGMYQGRRAIGSFDASFETLLSASGSLAC